MLRPQAVYELLLDTPATDAVVEEMMLGLTWTLCRTDAGSGLAMSPAIATRVLPWAGTLAGQSARRLAEWVLSWNPHEATVGMAALNALLDTDQRLRETGIPLFPEGHANLSVLEHFRPQLQGQRVVVVGRYPRLDSLNLDAELTVLERMPEGGDLPDPAAEYLLPEADWVFLTATSLSNKTFPRLAELSRDAKCVLMGPTTPWVESLRDFGIDYLAGVQVVDADALRRTVGEGGGVRIFDQGVRYQVLDLHMDELQRLRSAIAALAARREMLKREMEAWYASGQGHCPAARELTEVDARLSRLDTRFKALWDARQDLASA